MPKKIIVSLGVLLGLVAVSVLLVKRARPAVVNSNPLYKIAPEKITKLKVINYAGTVTFVQNEQGWELAEPVKDLAAAEEVVAPVVSTLLDAEMRTVVSENPAHFSDYGIGSTQVQVFLNNATPALDGYVGKSGPNYTDSYFRFNGQDKVYLVNGVPPFLFQMTADSSRLKRFFKAQMRDAVALSVVSGKTVWELEKSSDTWKNTKTNVVVSVNWFETLKVKIEALTIASFPSESDAKKLGFDKPTAIITAGWGNEKKTAVIGNEGKTPTPVRYIRIDGREGVFGISPELVKDLLDFLKTAPPKA